MNFRLAVLIPCFNEERTVGDVISDFRNVLPGAEIYVYDNNSSDHTYRVAHEAGAIVRKERYQGKGNVVRSMFADIDADIYILVDGDATYDANSAPAMIKALIQNNLEYVNGARNATSNKAYRIGHAFGNKILTGLIRQIFGTQFSDILSGYKIFSRAFVKSFPALSNRFEIETELTVHALELRLPCEEFITDYRERPAGSESKLSTFRDGWRILTQIVILVKNERPFQFFGGIGALLIISAVIMAVPLFETFLKTGLVPRFPTAILATGLVIVGLQSVSTGILLDTVTRGRRELKRIAFLNAKSQSRYCVSSHTIADQEYESTPKFPNQCQES